MSRDKIDSQRVRFARTAERVFAEILDSCGIRREDKPSTFPLRCDKAGKLTRAFAPDSCLPNQDLCVDLTTWRPRSALGYHPPAPEAAQVSALVAHLIGRLEVN
jgi:hypothetical protein